MTRACAHVMLGILLAALTSGWAIAQTQSGAKISKKEMNAIAGCLTRSGDQFLLLGSDGSTWQIQIEKPIDLTSLLGKRVEARGAVSSENARNTETKPDGNEKKKPIRGQMKASSIRQIEGACP